MLSQAGAVFAPAVFSGRAAGAQLPALPNLATTDALLLQPDDAEFARYQAAFNARTMLTPQLRALCKTPQGVSVMVAWCHENNLPFAVRCGGHSYEGLSQSTSVVIDTRLISAITVDAATKTAVVGAGTALGQLYQAIAPRGFAFPGGSCPTVGVSGHVLGGGYGYLARPFGLACDNALSIDLVDPEGQQIHTDAQQNADLFWACRGGGGGSFGIATSYKLQLFELSAVFTFDINFRNLPTQKAAQLMKEWQAWASHAPRSIDSNLVISKDRSGIHLRCSGQSLGSSRELRRELTFLMAQPPVVRRSYINAVYHFAGRPPGPNGWAYPSSLMKGKSDYATSPLTDDGLLALMNEVSTKTGIYVICDAYGGAIANTASDATAFAHRRDAVFCIQYGSSWDDPSATERCLDDMRQCYAAMRPYVSGAAYVNYCDLDLTDYPNAYWGQNLPRLKQIKSAFDPDNIFKHAQSVPLA